MSDISEEKLMQKYVSDTRNENRKKKLRELKEENEKLKREIRILKLAFKGCENTYESFKRKVSKHIYKDIIEKLEFPDNASRDEINDIIDLVTNNWEDNYDNYVEEFEESNYDD